MFVQLLTIWLFAIPAGYVAAMYFKFPLEAVFFVICLEEVVKVFFEARRLHSKNWIKDVISDLVVSFS